tara:strand:- start:24186 stop:24641 length:456 start_codon:yes stop_codon:yes gene_type:complete
MRAVIQRVSRAEVRVKDDVVGRIGVGLLVLLGVSRDDSEEDVRWLATRLGKVRIFEDDEGRMSRSLNDIGGEVLIISQFTLFGSMKKGSRPSFNRAAPPETAIPLYESFLQLMKEQTGDRVATGIFGADMKVELVNDGPVTLVLDSQDRDF